MIEPELAHITATTLEHYAARAEDFFAGTKDHDVSQNVAALLQAMQGKAPYSILDLGCGPGRDLRTFSQLGHRAIGLEGCDKFAEMARHYSGCDVWQQNFLQLDLPDAYFHGIFANASLFHVPHQALPRVLRELHTALHSAGVLFSSNPRGNNEAGWHNGRYGVFHDLDRWRVFMTDAGFVEIEHYFRPTHLPREQQPWLASVWRKTHSPT